MSIGVGQRPRRGPSLAKLASFPAAVVFDDLEVLVAVVVFGVGSGVAFATVVGPLSEVPVLLALVDVAIYFQQTLD